MGIVTININSKQEVPPSNIGSITININNREVYSFTGGNFTTETSPVYTHPFGNLPEKIKVITLPSSGLLKNNGTNVASQEEVLYSVITSSNFKYNAADINTAYQTSFTFDIADTGSSEYSGKTGTVTFNVSKYVNSPPTTGNITVITDHDTSLVITAANLTTDTTPNYNDPEGDAPLNLRINELPENGTLVVAGRKLLVNDIVSFEDINAGNFIYKPTKFITTDRTVEFDFDIQDTGSGQFSS